MGNGVSSKEEAAAIREDLADLAEQDFEDEAREIELQRRAAERAKKNIAAKAAKKAEAKKEKEKKKTPPKIVGLDDSDDESDKKKNGKSKNDKKLAGRSSSDPQQQDENRLKEDLDDLDRTFSSLGLVGKDMWKDKDYSEEDTRNFASSDRWNKNVSARSANEYLNSSFASHTRFPPGAGRHHHSQQQQQHHHQHLSRTAPPGGSLNATRTIKFSWDEEKMPPDRGTEDWKYKKVSRND